MHAELGAWLFLYFLTAWSLVLCLEWNPHSATNVTTSSSDSIPPAPIRSHFPFSTVELVSVPSFYFVFPSLSSWGSIPCFSVRNRGWALPCLSPLVLALIMVVYHICLPKKRLLVYFSQRTPWVLCSGLTSGTRKPLSHCPPGLDCLLWIPVLTSSRTC